MNINKKIKKTPFSLVITRFLLLNKRLLKKPSFVAILAVIPLLAIALGVFAQSNAGVVTIAIARKDINDSYAEEITDYLYNNTSLISFTLCKTENEALNEVYSGKADEAWIFNENSEAKMMAFAKNPSKTNAVITCVNREDTAFLKIAREKLYSVLYSKCTVPVYLDFISTSAPELSDLSQDELMEFYHSVNVESGLFEFSYADTNEKMTLNTDYVTAPFRGLCAVTVLLCSLAICVVRASDEKNGVFLPLGKRSLPVFRLCYQTSAVLDAGIVMLISLVIIGVSVNIAREILIMLLYILGSCGFCIILSELCRNTALFSTLIPITVIIVTLICPVFIDLSFLSPIAHIFPTYYYLRAVRSDSYILYSALYAVGTCGISLTIGK